MASDAAGGGTPGGGAPGAEIGGEFAAFGGGRSGLGVIGRMYRGGAPRPSEVQGPGRVRMADIMRGKAGSGAQGNAADNVAGGAQGDKAG